MLPMEKTAREIRGAFCARAATLPYFAGRLRARYGPRFGQAKDFDVATDATPDIVQKIFFAHLRRRRAVRCRCRGLRMDSMSKWRHFGRTARIWTTVIPSMFDFSSPEERCEAARFYDQRMFFDRRRTR